MTFAPFAIAGTFNFSASLVNIETITTFPPRATPLPLGSVDRVTLDGKLHVAGAQVVEWQFGYLAKSKLNSIVTTYIGGWDIASNDVTIVTLKRDETYGTFNARLHLPQRDKDYDQPTSGTVANLRLRFYVVGTAT